jgi:NAD(P)-dependent dehydrogenase (short-subunit alcohol dehydrogenase family)
MSLAKCIALVTGAGSGLGRATALRLAKSGASVVIVDLEKSPGMITEMSATLHSLKSRLNGES